MTWFERITGFAEKYPDQVRVHLSVDDQTWTSNVNCKSYVFGRLETPSLAELRERVQSVPAPGIRTTVCEVVANVQELHRDPANQGSLFQVASQFNLLEMVSPRIVPEAGVGIYEQDHTQGPACAIAAGAGTIYRNYLVPLNGRIGQSRDNQIDCLADMGTSLGNHQNSLWTMQNGYVLPSEQGLATVSQRLDEMGNEEIDELRKLLRIGLQWRTQVTLEDAAHGVTQAYCSALPVAYAGFSPEKWEAFARLVLEAAYEATLCAGILNARESGNRKLYLTLLGGGAFGNRMDWIMDSILRALSLFQDAGLEVLVVSYGRSCPCVNEIIEQIG